MPGQFTSTLLGFLLLSDGAVAIAAARVQLGGEAWGVFRVLPPSSAASPAAAGRVLFGGGVCLVWLAMAAWFLSGHARAYAALFGNVRALPLLCEMALGLHALAFWALAYGCDKKVAYGFLEPPAASYRSRRPYKICVGSAVGCAVLAVVLPLIDCGGDSLCWFEAYGNALWIALAAGIVGTHGMYTGAIAATIGGVRHPTKARAIAYVVTALLANGVAVCYTRAVFPEDGVHWRSYGVVPLPYALIVTLCVLCYLNWPPLAVAMHAWYTGAPYGGFEPSDAPRGRRGAHQGALLLLVLSLASCAAGTALLLAATRLIHLEAGDALPRLTTEAPPLANAEHCHVVWGLERLELGRDDGGAGGVSCVWCEHAEALVLYDGFAPEAAAAQTELLAACDLVAPSAALSPIHPAAAAAPTCLMRELHTYALTSAGGGAWPIAPSAFASTLVALLRTRGDLRPLVGFTNDSLAEVAWIRTPDLPSRFAYHGVDAVELAADPAALRWHEAKWDEWFDAMPHAATTSAARAAIAGRGGESILRLGWHECPKWAILATEEAFLDNVYRAAFLTPIFSAVALVLFLRSLAVSLAALYCLVGMVITILGALRLFRIPLGPPEALVLGLVVGVSVDYLVHIACAYNNSLFADRYYKSRAALFARAHSIGGAAATTLCATLPLLVARMEPLREFGAIFTLVTLASLAFALVAFVALMMVAGPLYTPASVATLKGGRPPTAPWARDDEEEERRRRSAERDAGGGGGSGWAVHFDLGEPHGVHGGGTEMHGLDRLDAPSTREMELVHGRRADGAGMGHLGGGGGGFRPPPPEEDSDEEML